MSFDGFILWGEHFYIATFGYFYPAIDNITGFINEMEKSYRSEFIVIEIKDQPIKLRDIYQTRRYSELFDAKYALLISTHEIPAEIKRLSKVIYTLLNSGRGYEKITLVQYDPEKGEFVEWFEKNPFKK